MNLIMYFQVPRPCLCLNTYPLSLEDGLSSKIRGVKVMRPFVGSLLEELSFTLLVQILRININFRYLMEL